MSFCQHLSLKDPFKSSLSSNPVLPVLPRVLGKTFYIFCALCAISNICFVQQFSSFIQLSQLSPKAALTELFSLPLFLSAFQGFSNNMMLFSSCQEPNISIISVRNENSLYCQYKNMLKTHMTEQANVIELLGSLILEMHCID